MRIMHLSPHLGGGVGRVLLNYLGRIAGGEHRLVLCCLDRVNEGAARRASALGLELHDRQWWSPADLERRLAEADLLVVHWWNHPLLYAWLVNAGHRPARVMLWSHVAGFHAPQIISPELAAWPDLFVVATPRSFQVPALAGPEMDGRLRLIFSCAGLEHVAGAAPRAHSGFRVGYLGTVDYVKLHPGFLAMSLAAGLEGARFPVAGGPKEAELAREAAALRGGEVFDFLGPIDDVAGFLSGLDIFGYPLNPCHYGTGEQALIEAQAAGLPQVVLAGGAEEYVVEDGRTGLVAADPSEYARHLRLLQTDGDLRRRLSARSAERARERFSLDRTVQAFEDLYQELRQRPKRSRAWPGRRPGEAGRPLSPFEIFCLSQGPELGAAYARAEAGGPAEREELMGRLNEGAWAETRGSAFHYHSFFPEDLRLARLAGILRAE